MQKFYIPFKIMLLKFYALIIEFFKIFKTLNTKKKH